MTRLPSCQARKGASCSLDRCDHGKRRRQPKGRRAKSGQWWRRTKPAWLGVDLGIEGEERTVRRVIDEHHDSRRVMEAMEKCEPKMSETHDEVDTDTGRGSIWIPKEQA